MNFDEILKLLYDLRFYQAVVIPTGVCVACFRRSTTVHSLGE
jgi:hypothetical protein